jgi:TetR/AcrR family transcriptional repressor of bet genes
MQDTDETSPPPRTLAREARRQQVIEATITTLAARGFARTTLTEVARTAGISHGLVLFHFETKEKLLTETLTFMTAEYHDNWQAALALAPADPAAQLLALIEADFAPAITTPARLGAWCAFWGEAQSRPIYQEACGPLDAAYAAQLEAICRALVAEGGYRVDPVLAARILRLVVEGTWLDMMTLQTPYPPAEARRTVMASAALCFPGHFGRG